MKHKMVIKDLKEKLEKLLYDADWHRIKWLEHEKLILSYKDLIYELEAKSG